ncbi:MAG TPA: hypothetical protein PKZ39_07145, partial [Clostridia bacterium]|nr:hypothetical protein [Clostridia bacterium]
MLPGFFNTTVNGMSCIKRGQTPFKGIHGNHNSHDTGVLLFLIRRYWTIAWIISVKAYIRQMIPAKMIRVAAESKGLSMITTLRIKIMTG